MISNPTEFSATLEYAVKLADALEGLRQYAQETGKTTLLPLSLAGPLAHLRESLADIRVYSERLDSPDTIAFASGISVFGVGTATSEREAAPQ